MKLNRLVFSFIAGLFLISFVSAQYFDFYYLQPSQFLESEWCVFALLFLAIFALVYIALGRMFSLPESRGGGPDPSKKGAIVVISLVIAVFGASSIVQRAFWAGYFGDVIINIFYIVAAIAGLILLFLAAVYIKDRAGFFPSVALIVAILWVIVKFFLSPYDYGLAARFVWENNLYWYFNFYQLVDHPYSIVVVGIIAVIGVLAALGSRPSRRGGRRGERGERD